MITKLKTIGLLSGLMLATALPIYAADAGFQAGLDSADRPATDKERDAARKPAQVIEFLGIESGMSVIDVIAGGGFYTEVLSAAVGPDGNVVSQNTGFMLTLREGRLSKEMKTRIDRLSNVEILVAEPNQMDAGESAEKTEPPVDLGTINYSMNSYAGQMDAAITALNLHDIYINSGAEGATYFLQNVYKVLKPGGVFVVIDHAGNADQDNNSLHRMDPAIAKQFAIDAGFEIDAESDLLHNPEDDRTLHMRDESLERNTDRFLLRLKKPA
jgi:predicted methyltransferase